MKVLLLVFMISQLCFVSCSDLKKESIQKVKLEHSSFKVTCKLDMDSLSNLLTKEIGRDIDCLESYLLLVANVLKSGKPRAIGRQEFKNLLEKGIDGIIEDIDPAIIKALDAVFELNFLIGSGDRNFITSEQIADLMEILKIFNKQVRSIYLDFTKTRKVAYTWHKKRREEHYHSIEVMIKPILKVFNQKRKDIDNVDFLAILDTFSTHDSIDAINTIRDFLIVKKIVLGGSTQRVSHIELYQLFKKLPAIAGVAYDIIKYKSIDFKELIDQVDFLNIALRDFGRDILIGGKAGNQKLFSIKELEIYFKRIYKKPLEIDYFEANDFITNMKKVFFGEGREFTGNQIRVFVNFVREIGHKFHYFLRMYDAHSDQLDRPKPLGTMSFNRLIPKNTEEKGFQKEFQEMFEKHLFFRKLTKPAVFSPETIKTPRSIIEYAGYEMLAEKLMRYWEKKHPCDGFDFTKKTRCEKEKYEGDLNPEQLRTLVQLGADFLDKADIIAKDSLDSTVGSITSLVDIFLHASDGNLQIDKYELTEFITMALSGIKMRKKLMKRLATVCPADDKNDIKSGCFKEEFFNEMFSQGGEVDYGKYFPLLKQYVGMISVQKKSTIIDDLLLTVRTCQKYTNGELVPVSSGSIYSALIVLMHVESIMIRFDKNRNSIIDVPEFNDSFYVFDEMIKSYLPAFKNNLSFKKKIVWHIFTQGEVPSIGKGIGLLFTKKSKLETNIERSDFIGLLRTIAVSGLPEGFDSCEKPRVN